MVDFYVGLIKIHLRLFYNKNDLILKLYYEQPQEQVIQYIILPSSVFPEKKKKKKNFLV